MENFSIPRMIPGIGTTPGIGPPVSSGFGIPGFDVIQRLFMKFGLDPSFLVTLGMSLTLLTSLLSFFSYSFGSLTALTRFVSANLVSSATIHSSDVTYLYIMRWLAAHKISTDCRLFCVTSRKNPQSYAVRRYSSYAPYGDGNRGCQEDDDDGEDDGCEDDSLGPKLKYMPAPGFLYFWHLGRPIIINRKLDLSYYTGDIPDETIVLTTIGRSPSFLRDILSEARRDYLQAQSRKTMVYTLSPTPFAQKTWDQGRHRPSRDISTVIMPPEEKEFLLQDVKEYLNPVTMRWYAQRGLPYRRGYLFHGPPGTGKTSLSLALAGELKLPLYILSLSTGSLTDETLTMLFVGLPRKCIVLLEDIDCAGVHRNGDDWDYSSSENEGDEEDDTSSDDDGSKKSSGKSSKGSGGGGSKTSGPNSNKNSKASNNSNQQPRRPRISVSFSGLLNAIDGVASHEGRILIMTTNHRERLDSALIRPGRVDVQMEFGYAGKETLAEIFRELYKEIGERGSSIGITSGGRLSEKKKHRSELAGNDQRSNVHQLAETFAEKIPVNRFTPAEIQGFLMSYKGQPEKAMEKIDAWVDEKMQPGKETKAKAKRNRKKNTGTEKPVQEKAIVTPTSNTNGTSPRPSYAFDLDPITTSNLQDQLTHKTLALTNECGQNILQSLLLHLLQNINGGKLITALSNGPGVAKNNGGNGYTNGEVRDDNGGRMNKDEACDGCATPNGIIGTNGTNGIGKKTKVIVPTKSDLVTCRQLPA